MRSQKQWPLFRSEMFSVFKCSAEKASIYHGVSTTSFAILHAVLKRLKRSISSVTDGQRR